RPLKPASTSSRVVRDSTRMEFPELPLPRMETFTPLLPGRRASGFRLLAAPRPGPAELLAHAVRELYPPSRHRHPCYLQKPIQSILDELITGTPAEGWNVLRRHLRAVEVAARADDGAGVEQEPDPGLYVVADQRSHLDLTSIDLTERSPDPDRAVVVLQVTVRGFSAQIDPAAEVGVPDVAIVLLVDITDADTLRQLAPNPTHGTDRDRVDGTAEDD